MCMWVGCGWRGVVCVYVGWVWVERCSMCVCELVTSAVVVFQMNCQCWSFVSLPVSHLFHLSPLLCLSCPINVGCGKL